jgi:hypothetical protein
MTTHRSIRWMLFALLMLSFSAASFAQVFISVRVGPPALPVYAQPLCPGPGYMWTPGYWAWNDDAGYYWVPGTWVLAPVGMLWTPGYWGWSGGLYVWHVGYWGPHIGFYGGVNYGFGYGGVGFVGGEWRGRSFYYNRSVTNVTNVTNVYNKTVIVNNTNVSHVSYNGGEGGVTARPTPEEERAANEHHQNALPAQTQHEHQASQNRENFASNNHGRPAIAATAKPGEFKGAGVVRAKAAGAEYHAPKMSPKEARGPSTPPNRNNAANRSFTPPSKGNQGHTGMSNNRGESKPFTPPNKNASGNAMHEPSKGGTYRPAEHSESRPAPQHQNAPKPAEHHESRPAPQHQSAPKPEEHHKGR